MSDIRIEFGPLELILLVFLLGWPGLLAGALVGVLAWRRRRVAGVALGALLGLCAVAAIRLARM